MEKYIPVNVLVANIKRKIASITLRMRKLYYAKNYKEWKARIKAYNDILSSLDTLKVEIDLEKEMDKEWNKCKPVDEGMGLEIASIEHEQFDNIAKHFYNLGKQAK